jgi:folate-dependent phosphoribosylglycinamide formyltransferase PurN
MTKPREEHNIDLVTNTEPHHKYWARSLCERHNVVAILHPHPPVEGGVLSAALGRGVRYGYAWFCLKAASRVFNRVSKSSMRNRDRVCEAQFFSEDEKRYQELGELIHHVGSVNDADAIQIVQDAQADIICFLGGDLAKNEFIDSARIASLNFHSGLSPFYNGAGTVYWAVSDFRPNFVGGTLMYINERIDGGPVIFHYLPSISADDDASSLFMKNITGAVKLYDLALEMIYQGKRPIGVVQQRCFRYVRGVDWTLAQDLRLRYFLKSGMMWQYVRDEQIVSYSDETNADAYTFDKTLRAVLKKPLR